jgi:lipopolysaccharide export system permease protein
MLGVIMLLAMVFDLAERLSEFIDNEAPVSDIIFGYYLNFIIFYGNTFSSLIIFIAVIWFTAKMAQETEIIPLLFMGRPFTRLLRPYAIAATVLTALSLILNHLVIPRSNSARLEFEERYYRERLVVDNYNAEFPNHQFVHFTSYIAAENRVTDFEIQQFDENNRLIHYLKTRSAVGVPGTNKWTLIDYYEKTITPPTSEKNKFGEDELTFKSQKLIEQREKDTILPFKINEMALRDNSAEAMTFTQLRNFIKAEKKKGNPNVPNYEIELHQRTSYPFATYVLTLIAVSVSSRKKRGGIGINLAIGFIFVFVYIFAMKITTVAAIKVGFPPIAAVWIPNVVFGLIGLFMYRLAPK